MVDQQIELIRGHAMFQRLSNGWELAKQSYRVLMLDKELLVFPLFSGIACMLVLASFSVPLLYSEFGQSLLENEQGAENPLAWVILFLFYLVNYFVIVFFNSALVACALIRFKGGDPTVGDGFRASMQRLPVIFAWAAASATVGIILKAIESRSERAGQIAASLLGAGWAIATYFVVPVLVVEKLGPIDAVKRSCGVLKKTWGESIGANFGIGAIVFVASFLCIIPLMGGFFLIAQGNVALGVALAIFAFVALMIVSLVSSALNSIILAALYLYAAEDQVPQQFDDGMMAHAFG